MKLKSSIIIFTIIILSIVTYLLFGLHNASKEEVTKRIVSQQYVAAQQLSREIESYLRGRTRGVEVLSSFSVIQNRDFDKMSVVLQEYFEYVKKDHVNSLSVYDENGTIIYSTNKNKLGQKYADSDFFLWATKKENKDKQFLFPFIQQTKNQTKPSHCICFRIVSPVYQEIKKEQSSGSGFKFVGMVTETIVLEEILSKILPTVSPFTTMEHAWILDKHGTVLYQSQHPPMVMKNINQQDETCLHCHNSFDHVETILSKKEGSLDYQLIDQTKRLASYATLDFKNISWTVVLNISFDEISGFVDKNLIHTFLLFGLIVSTLVGCFLLVSHNNQLKIQAQEEAKQLREKSELEDKIRESEYRYRQLVELSPDAIAIHCEGKIVFVNSAAVSLLGASSPNDLLGKAAMEIVHSDDRAFVQQRITEAIKSGKPAPMIEERFIRHDGSVIEVEVAAVPTKYLNKQAVQVVVRDITERRKSEKALKLFRTLIDRSNDAIEVIDPETGQFLDINEKGCLDLGYSREEILTLNLFDIDPMVNHTSFTKAKEGLRKSGELIWEGIHRRKDDSTFPVEVNIKYVRLDRDYLVTVVRDITERKKSEEKIQNDLNEKTLLLSEIHHRVKNNLQVITSLLNLQSQKVSNKEDLRLFNDSKNRIHMMARVHEKLYQSNNFAMINFKEYLPDVLNDIFKSSEICERVNLKMAIKDVVLGIDDAIPVALIVHELFSNSIKYAFPNDKKGTIEISFKLLDEDTFQLIFQDNGMGLPQNFDVDKTDSLGLNIVRGLVNQIVGEIVFERTEWSTFKITFTGFESEKKKYAKC
jgi:PAS domain S-box-containing protein